MKPTVLTLAAVLLGSLMAVGGAGCTATVTSRPAVVATSAHVYVGTPPPRVYYGGRWLHYRGDAYYYHDHGHWMVARSVPTHVVRYHRPVHVTHRRSVVPHRTRSYVRHRTTTRRPVHVRQRHRKADAGPVDFTEAPLVPLLGDPIGTLDLKSFSAKDLV